MKPEVIVLISALGGVLISSISNLIVTFLIKKYETQREIKKLILEFSLAEWKERTQFLQKGSGITTVYPVMHSVLLYSNLLNTIGSMKRVTQKKVEKILDYGSSLRRLFDKYDANANKGSCPSASE